MGVIYVVAEAMKLGFHNGHPQWCNLGQGQPEVGPMRGAPPRIHNIALSPEDHAYGPLGGTEPLREAIAAHYNRLFRQGRASQYTAENVSVASGGRLALTRIFSSLDRGRIGYQVPDYTAYEDMMVSSLHRVEPVLIATKREDAFSLPAEALARAIDTHKLTAYIFSNPCNPTGHVVAGQSLSDYVRIARERGCALVLDEFYSQFIYGQDGSPGDGPVSAAAYVEDVDRDPVLLVDGLTKGFRYPGWRLGWTVGPKSMIETLGRAASAIDGGPPMPIQRAALTVFHPARADQETAALRHVFAEKRTLMLDRLASMGVTFTTKGLSTFYLWGNIAGLPAPLDSAERFFREALARKVLTVPGAFFDVNPNKQRPGTSPFSQWMRFSFGPPRENVELGLDRLASMVQDAR